MNKAPLDVLKMIRDYKDQMDTNEKFKKCLNEIKEIKYIIKYNFKNKVSYSKIQIKEKTTEYNLGCNLVFEENGMIDEIYSDCHVRWYSNTKFGKWCIWDGYGRCHA